MDIVDRETRSRMMGTIRGKNTKPELVVRRLAHSLGYRFRLHRGDLPGSPDIAFPKFGAVIFVHGCFWHRHEGCRLCTTPSSNLSFWSEKFRRNVERDRQAEAALSSMGWRTMIVWECQTRDPTALEATLKRYLSGFGERSGSRRQEDKEYRESAQSAMTRNDVCRRHLHSRGR